MINPHPNIKFTNPDQGLAMGGVIADNLLVGRDGGIRMTDRTEEWIVLDA